MAALCCRRMLLPSSGRARLRLRLRPGPAVAHARALLRPPLAAAQPLSTGRKFAPAAAAADASTSSSPFGSRSPLERLRARQLRDPARPERTPPTGGQAPPAAVCFRDLRLSEELLSAVAELGLSEPTEVQSLGIPAVLAGESVVMASHTGSGKTLAYMLPIVQALRRDEAESGKATRSRRPRCLVLCPTRELAEQVFRVAKSICHHARFRTVMIGGGARMKSQEDTLNTAVDMIVGTPGRLLMHIKEGHMAYGDIKYVALDEADTMFDRGFAPEIRKILGPLRKRSLQPGDRGFQTVLVTATITKAVQNLLDEEFPGIRHIHTSSLHKKVASARHDFIKLSGAENKLEGLLQVLEPSLSKGNRVMVFCNTVNSCRAVDHHLIDNGVATVNYHGEVPADERGENLNKFREDTDGSAPALVCTDLAARGLDLVVDHVIMFDFPYNPIDYLHRTGRTARMGAKGRVTSLVSKRDQTLALQLEDAMSRGESLEALTSSRAKVEALKRQELQQRRKQKSSLKESRVTFKTAKARSSSAFGSKSTSRSPSSGFKAPKGTRVKARFEARGKYESNSKRSAALSMRSR